MMYVYGIGMEIIIAFSGLIGWINVEIYSHGKCASGVFKHAPVMAAFYIIH